MCFYTLIHEHHHHENSQDLNQKTAFLHVVADALTSVLAIIALVAGKYLGWDFLDALLGIVGAILVTNWACRLMKDTGKTLLDAEMNDPVVAEVYEVIDDSCINTVITDIYVWKVGIGKYACILALDTQKDLTAIQVRQALSVHDELVHVSVEINNKIDKFHVEHI